MTDGALAATDLSRIAPDLLNSLIEGCQIIGFDYRYLYVNDSVVAQARLSPDQLIGRTMMDCYPGIDRSPMFAVLRRCMTDRIPSRMENEFTFPDDSKGWFELRFVPIPEGVCVLSLDITGQKRSTATLRDLLMPSANSPSATAAASTIPQFARDRRQGLLDFWTVYDAHYDRVQEVAMRFALAHPEFAPLIGALPAQQMQEENARSRELLRSAIVDEGWEAYEANTRLQGAHYATLGVSFGGWYEVIRIFQQVLVPVLVETYRSDTARLADAIAGMMAFLDHAMVLIAEQYLRSKEEDRFRLLVESIKDYAVIMLDVRGHVTSWNAGARRLKGYEDGEAIGQHFSIFYTSDDRKRGKPDNELRIAGDVGRYEDEGWRVRKDGSRFWANVVVAAVRNAQGKLLGFAKVTRDLTERRHAEDEREALVQRLQTRGRQLEEANAELDGFTYSVSHDLRAPLRAIDGFARVLIEDHASSLDEDGKRVVQIIGKNTRKMDQLIDDLLNFARLGRHELRASPLDMTALARSAGQDTLEPGRQIELRIANLPGASGDPALLRQVWLNLLANAIKYTRPRPLAVIEVTGDAKDAEVVYSVKDNGVGFDPQYQKNLFGVFQRLHPAADFEGTGVGLALVQRIVRRHGGWVKGESALGEGATFSFALPRKDVQDGP